MLTRLAEDSKKKGLAQAAALSIVGARAMKLSWIALAALFVANYLGQEAAHYFTGESTYRPPSALLCKSSVIPL